ncbi:hypothetical protein TruAng_011307 [Truncatella angustata]|nr:hypothetical protein TruAng_011307 [Truncatella angustata]
MAPQTKKAQKLELENFRGPLVTHGIDVIGDPKAGEEKAVYIFAVNHLPDPEYFDESYRQRAKPAKGQPKARSQIEIFRHEIGSPTAQHLRSVRHSLIKTPNDILALGPTHFLVTNDHHYREGFMREIEEIYPGATWTETVDIELTDMLAVDPEAGVTAAIALDSIHNNNGLGHGRTDAELLVASAIGGTLHLVEPADTKSGHTYRIVDEVFLDSTIDNPSYFNDPYASSSYDASGFVLAGLARGVDLAQTHTDPAAKDPVLVWYVRKVGDKWEKRLIFEDDGTTVRTASAAVLVAIDPAKEGGKRRAWLFVTGFLSANAVAIKIDL